jgi:hypothetical protein
VVGRGPVKLVLSRFVGAWSLVSGGGSERTMSCEFGIRVFEQIEAYPPGVFYWSELLAFGAVDATTLEQAESRGWDCLRRGGLRRAARFTVQHFCSHCHTRGVEPGFKRKKCSQCAGLGTCEIP